jgi:3-phosphoshikimate 1-carboxyvinyltransferase
VKFVAQGPLRGIVRTPGDKSVSHRAVLLGALADGVSVIRGLSDGDDVAHTLAAVVQLGAAVTRDGATVTVTGGRLHAAADPVDCGNSGTGMRLLAGVVAGLDGSTTLFGDDSLSTRPMDRVADPLTAMGATVWGDGKQCRPPIDVVGGPLTGIEWTLPVASAQVKSAILLAGLSADGETVVHEPVPTRAHTEEMLADAGADITVEPEGNGRVVRLRSSKLEPIDVVVPGDPSQAAFWVVAGCIVPGSSVAVEGIYTGAERIGFVGVLQRMGARVDLVGREKTTATVTATAGPLRGTVVEAAEIPSLDEVPILAVAAAAATGETTFRDVGELRVKESDRLAGVADLVRAFGADAEVVGDDLVVRGAGRLSAGSVRSLGDHRMAMAAAVASLAAGEGDVDDVDCIATSYPGFVDDLVALGGSVVVPRIWVGTPAPPVPRAVPAGGIIAIDGPAGSGKSTVSRTLAKRLGIQRLDTGAMYRAIAWAALDRGIDPADAEPVADVARDATIDVGPSTIRIDGTDVTGAIRSPVVSRAVSVVAANPDVRAALVERQRRWALAHGGGVVEGRDIGTTVFPGAVLKVYLDASPEERARRRHDEPADGVARRDRIDSTRAASPLYAAADAHVVDTTGRTVDEVIEQILSWL